MMKKGVVFFSTLITFAAIVILLMLATNLSNRESRIEEASQKPFELAQFYDQAYANLVYIDQAATYSAYQAIHEWAGYGGYVDADAPSCRNYGGSVTVWYDGDRECYPTREVMDDNFTKIFLVYFEKYLIANSLRFNLSKLAVLVDSKNNQTELTGLTDAELSVSWANLGEQYYSPSFKTTVDFDVRELSRVVANARLLAQLQQPTQNTIADRISQFNTQTLTWQLEQFDGSFALIRVTSTKQLPYFDGNNVVNNPVVIRFALSFGAIQQPSQPEPVPQPQQTECEQGFSGAVCTSFCNVPNAVNLGQGPGASHGCYEADENKPICCSSECELNSMGACRNQCETGEMAYPDDYGCSDREPTFANCCYVPQT